MAIFKYGTEEFDSDKLAKYLHDNAKGWAEHLNYGGNQEVMNGINELIGRIQSGDLDSLDYAGNLHSNTDFTNNSRLKHLINYTNSDGDRKGIIRTGKTLDTHGIAASFLDDALTAYSKNKAEAATKADNSKSKFVGKNWVSNSIFRRWFNGTTPNEDSLNRWRGTRDKSALYGDIATALYENQNDLDNYDYTGTNTSAENMKQRIEDFRKAVAEGKYEDAGRAYTALGGNDLGIFLNDTQQTTTLEQATKSLLDQAVEDYRKQAILKGHSEESANKMAQAYRELLIAELHEEERTTTADNRFNLAREKALKESYTPTSRTLSYKAGDWKPNFEITDNTEWDDLKDYIYYKYNGWESNDKQTQIPGIVKSLGGDDKFAKLVENALKTGNYDELKNKGMNPDEAIRYYLERVKNAPGYLTEVAPGRYLIHSTYNPVNMSALVYDKNNRRLLETIRSGNNTSNFNKFIRDYWDKKDKTEFKRKGGILKALRGVKMTTTEEDRNERIQKMANEQGKNVDQIEVGYAKGFSTKDDLAKQGIKGGYNNSDYLRLASALQDLASIGASYAGPGGMAASGVLGLTSLGTDFAADLTDDSVSAGDMWTNAAINAGWAVAGMIPGLSNSKIAKAGKTIMRFAPLVYSAIQTAENPDPLLATFNKIKRFDFDKLTTNDYKNIFHIAKMITGVHNSAKQTAGEIGISYGRKNKIARGMGRWGNNAFGKESLKAYNKAIARQYQYPNAIRLNPDNTVTIGGQKVQPATAKAMLSAARRAALKGATKEQIQAAALEAYKNSPEGIAQIGTATPGLQAQRFADFKSLRQGLRSTADSEGNFNINGQKLNALQLKDLRSAYLKGIQDNSTLSHAEQSAAGLKAANTKFGEMFDKPEIPANPVPNFNFDGIKGTTGFWGGMNRLWRGNLEATSNSPSKWARAKNFVHPDRENAFDPNTAIGKHNLNYINSIRLAYGNKQPKYFANNIEYNMGLVEPFGTKINLDGQLSKRNSIITKTREEATKKANEQATQLKQQRADARIRNKEVKAINSALGINIKGKQAESINNIKSQINNYARVKGITGKTTDEILAQITALATAEGRSPMAVLRNINRGSNPTVPKRPTGPITKSSVTLHAKNANKLDYRILNKKTGTNNGKRQLTHASAKELKNRGAKPFITITNKAENDYWALMLGLKGSSTNPVKINQIWKDSYGNFYYFKDGGSIPKYLSGGSPRLSNVPDSIYSYGFDPYSSFNNHNQITGLEGKDQSKAGSTLTNNAFHKNEQGTGAVGYLPYWNKYASNFEATRKDALDFLNKNYGNNSTADAFTAYNKNVDTIRSYFSKPRAYTGKEDAETKALNILHKGMYGTLTGDDYFGYSPSTEGIAGTSTNARRALGYEKDWNELNDDEKRQRLLNLDKFGYAYHDKLGHLQSVGDDELIRLGIKESPETDISSGTITKVKRDAGKGKTNPLSNLKLDGIDPGLAQIPLGLAANNRMRDYALSKRVSLGSTTPIHRQVQGNYQYLINGLNQSASTKVAGNKLANNIADSSTSIAAQLEANKNANILNNQGMGGYLSGLEQSKEAAFNQEKENITKFDTNANENNMRLTLKYNADRDVLMAHDPYANIWKPFIMEKSYDWKTNKAQRKQNAIKAAQINLEGYRDNQLKALKEKALNSGKDEDYAAYLKAAREITDDPTYKSYLKQYYQAQGLDTSKLDIFNNSKNDNTFSYTGPLNRKDGGKLKALKSGSKVSDDGPVKTRSKDADRFQKAVKHAADSHDKKLARLAAATLLELKRTMGK